LFYFVIRLLSGMGKVRTEFNQQNIS